MDRATHWNRVYTDKGDAELSWFQTQSALSLEVMDRLALPKDAAIIDVGGGGPSALVAELLDRGYTDISVLDISAVGLQRCRDRLGNRADQVHWLEGDVTRFNPSRRYRFWHDRAVFHFLTDPNDRKAYLDSVTRALSPGGHALICTFAADGPPQCSGLDVVRWTPEALAEAFGGTLALIESFRQTHQTPWGKPQAFLHCLFRHSTEEEAR